MQPQKLPDRRTSLAVALIVAISAPMLMAPLPPDGANLKLVASACAVEESGVANDLPGHIVLLELTARLGPPGAPALSPGAWAVLGILLIASGCWAIRERAATVS